MTADEIFEAIVVDEPEIALSTIYRALDALEDVGAIQHIHLGHGKAVYHLDESVHQHLVCERCQKTLEVPEDFSQRMEIELHARLNFHVKAHHFSILGLCDDCFEAEVSTHNQQA